MVRAHVNHGGEIQQSELLVQVVLDELADPPEPRPGQASRRGPLDRPGSTCFAACGWMPDLARSAFIGRRCSGRCLDSLTAHGSCPSEPRVAASGLPLVTTTPDGRNPTIVPGWERPPVEQRAAP